MNLTTIEMNQPQTSNKTINDKTQKLLKETIMQYLLIASKIKLKRK